MSTFSVFLKVVFFVFVLKLQARIFLVMWLSQPRCNELEDTTDGDLPAAVGFSMLRKKR